RRYDPETGLMSTVASGLAEPSDVVPVGDQVLVVESAGHRLTCPPLSDGSVGGRRQQVVRSSTQVAPGKVRLAVVFQPGAGRKLDETYGPSTRLTVTADPPELLVSG